MTETNGEDSAVAPVEGVANNRDREHQVLQQVLMLLAEPAPSEQTSEAQLRENNVQLRTALSSMAGLLRDKSGQCLTLERKVSALNLQITSLKEVVAITKDLLNIRDMEVQHLNKDINNIQEKINGERQRHNEMIGKMDAANKLSSELKKEYETQLKLFQELKEKYAQRAELLEKEDAKKPEC